MRGTYNRPASNPPDYYYACYGISMRSDAALPFLPVQGPTLCQIELENKNCRVAESVRQTIKPDRHPLSAFHTGSLPDGSYYVALPNVGEILVSSDGRALACYRAPQPNSDSFNIYLLSQAFSFALINAGFEPLHATAMAINGKAVIFLGECGYGKSTIAAALLQAGYPLLTDDLLLLHDSSLGLLAYPGAPRLKIFPEMARILLGDAVTGMPMNPFTRKSVISLTEAQICNHSLPVGAVYLLAPPDEAGTEIELQTMTERQAFVTLLASTFTSLISNPFRLRRQFEAARTLANTFAVRRLSYPRTLETLPAVLKIVTRDFCTGTPS